MGPIRAAVLTRELTVVADDGVRLAGTLTLPASASPVPAVVAIHGASGGVRGAQLLTHLADVVPRAAGVAVLTFDRRGEGESGGSAAWAGLDRLAADAAAWVDLIRRVPEVDAHRVGLWAHSQGGWIAPLVAAGDPAIAFLIAVSPCGVSPAEQMSHATGERLDEAWAGDADFDVRPALRALRVPALAVFGDRDRWVPVEPSVAAWQNELGEHLTTAVLPGAGHSLTTSFDPDDPEERGSLHPRYEPLLRNWLLGEWASLPPGISSP